MKPSRMVLASLLSATVALGASASIGLAHAGQPAAAPSAPQEPRAAPAYIAVIDAGSSGTRLELFTELLGGLAVTRVMKSSPNTAGLSSFAKQPQKAGPDAVAPLLAQLDTYLTDKGIALDSVPVALQATAGLRALTISDAPAVAAILDSTQETLDASVHPVLANGILPATQEASLAWVDTNALTGTLDNKVGSVGIVEIGGASAQVAFRTSLRSGPGVTRVKVAGEVIPLVAISYLGLGVNMARDAMQAAHEGGDFCLPRNASGTDPEVYNLALAIPVTSDEALYKLRACTGAYAGVIEKTTASAAIAPADLRTRPGFAQSTFVGLGSVPFALRDLGVSPTASDDNAAMASGLRSTCGGKDAWPKVYAVYGEINAFAEAMCPNASLVRVFIFGKRGVGIDGTTFDGDPEYGDRAPSWTAGYATTILHP